MKTNFFTLIVMAIGILASTSAFAQPTAPGATEGSTRYANVDDEITYSVTGTQTTDFVWAIRSGGSNTGTAPTISSTTNEVAVDWTDTKSGDIYYLDVYYVDASGCYSEMLTFQITITNAELCIATTTTTVGGTSVEAPSVEETCSLIETDTSGNSVTADGGDVTDFYLTITGGVPSSSYSVLYSVDGASQTAVSISTDSTGAGALKVTVDFTDFASSFTNDGTTETTVVIAAVSADDANGFTTTSTCSFDVTVHETPTISFQ